MTLGYTPLIQEGAIVLRDPKEAGKTPKQYGLFTRNGTARVKCYQRPIRNGFTLLGAVREANKKNLGSLYIDDMACYDAD